jgi:fructose-1,6-bisphosphatase/inositol monophosphatase family enzyme
MAPQTSIWASHLILVATACAGIYAFVQKRKRSSKYNVPSDLVNSPYGKEVVVALELALKAGLNMIAYCDQKGTEAESGQDLEIKTKGQPEDFCTRVDIENENLVMEGLLKSFPTHTIIGEESVGNNPLPPLTTDPTWIIDPIDGNTNFASGLPLTCVSIGFCDKKNPVIGVVYAPMTDEVYLAVRGYGAYRNGVKITQRETKALCDAVVCFEFGYARDQEAVDKMVGAVRKILEHGCRTCRCLGSGVLDLCYVATGRLDVVYAGVAGEGWKPWDYCAGFVVATEAGCTMQPIAQLSKTDFDIYSSSVICGVSSNLVQELRATISRKCMAFA